MATGNEDDAQSKAIMVIVHVARREGFIELDGSDKPSKIKRVQKLKWDLPQEIIYGTAVNTLPEAHVVEGNQDVDPVYVPARSPRLVGQGDHFFNVRIAGNEGYEPAELQLPIRVRRAPLHVKAPRLTVEAGTAFAPLVAQIDGLVGDDRVHVEFDCVALTIPSVSMVGFPITPRVVFEKGLAANYDITLDQGLLKVRPSEMQLSVTFSGFRERIKKLPSDRQAALDAQITEIGTLRNDEDLDGLAQKQHELETDIDRLEYFEVTEINIDQHLPRLPAFGGELFCITASVSPANASEPGIRWSVDRPELATIDQDGTLRRTGAEGGTLRVTATSLCRAGIIKSTVINVEPRPQRVEIVGPINFFLDDPAQLNARVDPPEADQRVIWTKVAAGWKKNAELDKNGLLKIVSPTQSGGSSSGVITVRMSALLDSSIQSEGTISFGGKKTTQVTVLPRKSVVELGGRITLNAEVKPQEAAQEVVWELDDDTIARLENVTALSADVVMIKGGTVSARALASDGTSVEGTAQLSVKVDLVDFNLTCPTTLRLVDTLTIVPVFTPNEASCRVAWSIAEAKGGLVGARLEKGVLYPTTAGVVRLTVSVPETSFKKTVDIQITADENMAVTATQWPQIKGLVEKYIKRLNAHDVTAFDTKAKRWLYGLQQDFTKNNASKTLKTLHDELIALRDLHYRMPHSKWLEYAGFIAKTNCYIRSDSKMDHFGKSYPVHMTMFQTEGDIEVGAKNQYEALEKKIYRINVAGLKSMHATLYTHSTSKDDQVKVYCSGEDWTPPYSVRRSIGTDAAFLALKNDLQTWMGNKKAKAEIALRKIFDDAHQFDDEKLG